MTPNSNPDPVDREIEQALAGINLQEMDLAPQRSGSSKPGERLYDGVIVGVSGDDVIVELGPRMQGACSLAEFVEPPAPGEKHRFVLHGQEDGLWILSKRAAAEISDWEALEVGSLVKARVTGQNQGGLTLKIGKHEAFMPSSQVSTDRAEDISQHLGSTLTAEVLEIDRSRDRVLLSRRRVQEAEALEAMQDAAGRLAPGSIQMGKVTRIEPFGAFVSLGSGIEGLLHVSNISRQRIENPSEVLSVGQEVQVKILEIKDGGRRIGLGIKQLEPDPWQEATHKYQEESVITGKVTRIMDFGAFVELEPGLEGLLHISQLGRAHVKNVGSVLSVGQEVTVRITSIEPGAKRISLSMLDPRGAVIGSEDSVDGADIAKNLATPATGGLSTSLGDLFKKALQKPDGKTG
ncbi:MAG: S1 RNA-binding domain-containing protein [Planctomycetes bacterium]|nr:S1 RNA-binding domain-containing protein [Planctomycetota bacterium]MCB9909161.1 S1 RNA-binding domain-containing protein [Planctomycetota bacterium]HPF15613.1 S1 RNA-binding domain-containing protein [Planctomycetota bacterium]HRV80457.1 S1 RNA-binding domain-containing protein [Planctomycetota bacterium]